MRDYPELAAEWIRDEEMSAKSVCNIKYFQDINYREIFNIAQSDLFKKQDLSDLAPAYDCSCTN